MYGNGSHDKEEPWVKHTRSNAERTVSNDPALSVFADLQPSPRAYRFDAAKGEWAFEVHGQARRHPLLGILVIRGNAFTGQLITTVE